MIASETFDSADRSNPPPRVLVSVLSFNSACFISKTLRSLQLQTYPHFDLQVADNNSTDETREIVRRDFPTIRLESFTENLGYTGGNNRVLAQALAEGYDYVVIANHDIEVEERGIEQLVETALLYAEDAGVVGAVEVRIVNHEKLAAGVGRYSHWTSRHGFSSHLPSGNAPQSVPFVHGALVLFTARALQLKVRLDENLFMYYDEADIGFQLRARGLRAYIDPRVLFRHRDRPQLHNGNSREWLREGYLMQRNRLYMVRKHGAWYHTLFYHFYAVLLELPAKFILRCVQGHARFAVACVRGHIDGLRGMTGRGRDF